MINRILAVIMLISAQYSQHWIGTLIGYTLAIEFIFVEVKHRSTDINSYHSP